MQQRAGQLAAVLSAALSAATLSGCAAPAPIDVWVAGEMVTLTDRIRRVQDPQVFDAGSATVKLFAAANETVSFQIVVDAGPSGARDLRIEFDELAGPTGAAIPGENLRAFRMWPVRIASYPPWYLRLSDAAPVEASFYDPLSPIGAHGPIDLKPAERLAIWVDLRVPRRAVAGGYGGRVAVESGLRRIWTARIELEVYDFVLPDARPLAAVGGFDHRTLFETFVRQEGKPYVPVRLDRTQPLVRRGLTIVRQLMRLAHDHRLDLFDRRIRPILKRDMFGKVRMDWEDYDAIVMPYLSGSAFDDRIGCAAWPAPFSEDYPRADNYGGASSDAYVETAGAVIAECAEHFTRRPEMAEQVFYWPYRGPVNQAAYARHARLARLIRSADPRTPILSLLPPRPPALTRWRAPKDFGRLADIYAPRAEWLDPALAASLAGPEHPLRGVWLSPGAPPYLPCLGVIATAADVRAVPWFAMKYGCTGLFIPEVLNWSGDLSVAEATAVTRLFYPGTVVGLQAVLPSVRLKRLRRGLQDLAYLWLLKTRQRTAIATAVTNAMVRYAGLQAVGDNYLDARLDGWVKDAAAWRSARRILAEEVQAAVHPMRLSNRKLLEARLRWKRFDEKVHTIRLEQVRSRVVWGAGGEGREARRLRATVFVDLYNEHARGVDLLARIDALPEGWRAVRGEARLEPLPAGTRRVVTLAAEGAHIPAGPEGKMPLPISITVDAARRKTVIAPVAFIRAGRVSAPPVIDGKLDDWPMRLGNTAAGFKLIGRRGRRDGGLAARQTLVFVLCDRRNLYVAFRCEEPNMSGVFARPSNVLHYEQLMATGEDLVELILDPGAQAETAEDLYHVAVKANGVPLFERGIASSPPLGVVRPWPVAATVAVGRQEKLWIVEMAIPLEAFGQAGKQRFWGVNFTRYATQGAEASSWSGAPRYFYDPRNVGTMFVPRQDDSAPAESPAEDSKQ